VTGRGRTCDAPRFKRALYRLSYGHGSRRSRIRTGGLLLIREALCQLSYPPMPSLSPPVCPAPSSELDTHAGCCRRPPGLHIRSLVPCQRCCPCHSPTLRPWIAGLGVDVLRGGELEPSGPWCHLNGRVKATRSYTREIPATIPGRTFLSQAGPQVGLEFFKLSITF
jgi:hypothetical protein